MKVKNRDGVNNMVIRIRIGAVLLVVTFLATFLSILFGCTPMSKHWQINPDPGSMPSPLDIGVCSTVQILILIQIFVNRRSQNSR